MRSELFRRAAAITLLSAGLGACVQATRHSNTMLFGTSTQFGIRAGQSATSVPEINVGYARQEAVVMPLVANTSDNGTYQTPCNVSAGIPAPPAGLVVHPCLLVAVNGKAQDSYSVLASFGAQFDGSVQAGGTGVKGGLAQYFATGVAAQMLAISGGASVVAVGDAATAAAAREIDAKVVRDLYGDEPVRARGIAIAKGYDLFQERLLAKIRLTKPDELKSRIDAFETSTGTVGQLSPDCTSIAACADAVTRNDALLAFHWARQDRFDAALTAWKTD
jgi:hypothetical protein